MGSAQGGSAFWGVCLGSSAPRGVGQTPQSDTIGYGQERAVRILLECILVLILKLMLISSLFRTKENINIIYKLKDCLLNSCNFKNAIAMLI